MAWTLLLLGLLTSGSGQGPGLCTLGAPPSRVSGHFISITTAFSLLSLLGVEAQTVIQEPSLSVSPGGTVTLTCGLSSGSVTTNNEPSWCQQTPGQAPRNVIYNTNTRLPIWVHQLHRVPSTISIRRQARILIRHRIYAKPTRQNIRVVIPRSEVGKACL